MSEADNLIRKYFNLKPSELIVLKLLKTNKEPMSIKEISSVLEIDRSAIQLYMYGLLEKNLIIKTSVNVSKGRKFIHKINSETINKAKKELVAELNANWVEVRDDFKSW